MLAILVAVKKYNAYLVSRPFQVKTDYSFNFLLDQKVTTPAQQTWVVKMMGYDYEVSFKKGSSNTSRHIIQKASTPTPCYIWSQP